MVPRSCRFRSPRRLASVLSLLALSAGPLSLADEPLTRPERSGFSETSSYTDVMEFLRPLAEKTPWMHLTTFGYTYEGRALPLAVIRKKGGFSPRAIREDDRIRILIMANIHAGEVCGKEASLMLIRDLAAGRHAQWIDRITLLLAPIYNADGNERVALDHRPLQNGPVGGMGQRPNAQGYDLNRDHMKLDTPEARSLVRLMNLYDPDVVVDLHTTDGSRHGYMLTYSPPLHPDTAPAITHLLRDSWFPAVSRALSDKDGWQTYFYGNVPRLDSDARRGWYTFDHRPRFNNNYVGLRNRFAILSEAYAYATFKDRVHATLRFVEEIVSYALHHRREIRRIVRDADAEPLAGRTMALAAAAVASPQPARILLGDVLEIQNPYSGGTMLLRTETVRPEIMPEFGTFEATETQIAPTAYLVPAELTAVLDRLRAHGVRMLPLAQAHRLEVQVFHVERSRTADKPFQQHRERTVTGHYLYREEEVPAGTFMVAMNQPLGRLIFHLLEPRSDDGLLHWNLMDRFLSAHDRVPILRINGPLPEIPDKASTPVSPPPRGAPGTGGES